jgi:DNA repair photolyase
MRPAHVRHRLLDFLGDCTTWSVTPYPRCEFRCVYCITRAQGISKPLYPADSVVRELRRELAGIPSADNITVGALSDAYPPAEERYGVTRLIVAELIAQQRTFAIVTKGRTVCRDIDLLAGYAGRCVVQVSLCTLDEGLLHRLDPGAPSAAERLKVVRTLHRRGVPVSISAAPWIPGISSARELLERAPTGVKVQFAPLNVERPWVPQAFLGRRFRQEEVDRLYLRERESVGYRRRAIWLYPVTAISGANRSVAHPFAPMPRLSPRFR